MREEDRTEQWPEIPEWADVSELDGDVRRDLRGLSKEGAEFVGRHLVAAVTLADEDPALAWRHARAARVRGGRVAVVRETVGLVAYRAGEWAEAMSELRAARRMGGGPGHLAVMADSERALGHPERAIELARSAEADQLDADAALELRIVVAGARADLGQLDAALVHLEASGVSNDADASPASTNPRLAYAYADLLERAGRPGEALNWFIRATDADADEETDAGDRIALLAEAGVQASVPDIAMPAESAAAVPEDVRQPPPPTNVDPFAAAGDERAPQPSAAADEPAPQPSAAADERAPQPSAAADAEASATPGSTDEPARQSASDKDAPPAPPSAAHSPLFSDTTFGDVSQEELPRD